MPLPFALPFALLVGLAFAWLARAELARAEVALVVQRPFVISAGFGLLVVAPVIGYFTAFHGDWSYLYVVSSRRIPSAVDLAATLVSALGVPLGFGLAAPWAIEKRGARLATIGYAVVASACVAALFLRHRLAVSATFEQFHGRFGLVPVTQSTLGRGILAGTIALTAGIAWSVHALRASSRIR